MHEEFVHVASIPRGKVCLCGFYRMSHAEKHGVERTRTESEEAMKKVAVASS